MDVDVDKFFEDCNLRLARLDLYPEDNPHCYCVGFQATINANDRQMYADVQVPLSDCNGKQSEELAALGWSMLNTRFFNWYVEHRDKAAILGATASFLRPSPTPN